MTPSRARTDTGHAVLPRPLRRPRRGGPGVIGALILAAGQARRMGSPKLLLRLGGQTLLARVIEAARASRCDQVLVVLGARADRVGRVAAAAGVRTVVNTRYPEGMGTSLAAGVAALPAACEAVVVLLGDQPFVTAAAVDALIDAYRATGKPLVASRYGAVTGAPTLIARPLFAEAERLSGDAGARVLMRGHPDLVTVVDLGPRRASWDVDTPEDFERAREAVEKTPRAGRPSPSESQ